MKIDKEENDNFWVAYADLMAGLLFIFILLIGGIIVKYVLTQTSLKEKEKEYTSTLAMLQDKEKHNLELEALNKIFVNKLKNTNLEIDDLRNSNSAYIVEIDELKKIIEDLNDKSSKLSIELEKNIKEKEAQKQAILDLNLTKKEKEKRLLELKNRALEQDKKITGLFAIKSENESTIENLQNKNKADEQKLEEQTQKIVYLLEQMSQREKDYNQILQDLDTAKSRIRNLTGLSVKVIADIKDSLGDSVEIDPKSGALTLSSSVLFDKGSHELKEEAKNGLKETLKKYFDVLMKNKDIRENLDSIIIEGHTDSDGSYIYNLELSQLRAFSVMEFINSWNKDENLKRYLIASGRSFMSPILVNGLEDKDASRRIEIKFLLSNKSTINEIEKLLNYDRNTTKN
ncbi:OmpA domain-containing protein [Campylobacter blaseri]|uniref:Chemotaxis protein MotB n=1 Tax=Campylobacter blaseri TaxID=2042961 RepID=A0A2P8R259_9BACT|nr:OmpA family protein [Campylobacter blaseri]PSM52584.1 chemotaxis protein MotB [Campylobacter blaseri]PSM54232.1 chemotaxis protein MotB [Campylobacter blaseri]QKF85883.1 OmpA domain-containing protein [Campylobacter blaseri]